MATLRDFIEFAKTIPEEFLDIPLDKANIYPELMDMDFVVIHYPKGDRIVLPNPSIQFEIGQKFSSSFPVGCCYIVTEKSEDGKEYWVENAL